MKLAHSFPCLVVVMVIAASARGGSTVATPQAGDGGAGSPEPSPEGAGNRKSSAPQPEDSTKRTNVAFSVTSSEFLCPQCEKSESPAGSNDDDFFSRVREGFNGLSNEKYCQELKTKIMCIRENKCPEVPEMKQCDYSLIPKTECGKCEYLLKNRTEDARLKNVDMGSDDYCRPLFVPLACFAIIQCEYMSDLHKRVASQCESMTTVCRKCKNSLEESVKSADKLLSILGGGVCKIIKLSLECLRDNDCAPEPDSTVKAIHLVCPDLNLNAAASIKGQAVRVTGPCRAAVVSLSAVAHLTAWFRA